MTLTQANLAAMLKSLIKCHSYESLGKLVGTDSKTAWRAVNGDSKGHYSTLKLYQTLFAGLGYELIFDVRRKDRDSLQTNFPESSAIELRAGGTEGV